MAQTKVEKSKAGYLHVEDTQYECKDCPMWTGDDTQFCVYLTRASFVPGWKTCSYFSKGPRGVFGFVPLGLLTAAQVDLTENEAKVGYSCKRCEYMDPRMWDCAKVDRYSPGDDPDMIHPDACCNFWSPDGIRGSMETSDFYKGNYGE